MSDLVQSELDEIQASINVTRPVERGLGGVVEHKPTPQASTEGAFARSSYDLSPLAGSEFEMIIPEEGAISSEGKNKEEGKRYNCFFVPSTITERNSLCGAYIGHGSSVCVNQRCGVAKHQGAVKAPMSEDQVFISKTLTVVFAQPTLLGAVLTTELYSSWANGSRTLDRWTTEFEQAELSFVSTAGVPVTKKELDSRVEFAEKAGEFRTPVKGPRGLVSFLPEYEPIFTGGPEEKLKFIQARGDEFEDILEPIVALDEGVTNMSARIDSVETSTNKSETRLLNTTAMLEGRIDELQAKIGVKPPALDRSASFSFPTLWATLAALISVVDWMMEQYGSLRQELTDLNATTSRWVVDIPGRFESLIGDGEKRSKSFALAAVRRLNEQVNSAVLLMDEKVDSFGGRAAMPDVDISWTEAEQILSSRISTLDSEMAKQKAQTDETAIKFGNMGFTSSKEAAAWLDMECGGITFGYLVDFHMLMENVDDEAQGGSETMKRLKLLQSIGISTINAGTAISSFDRSTPKWFSEKTRVGSASINDSCFTSVKTWGDWGDSYAGMNHDLEILLAKFEASHCLLISSDLIDNPVLQNLATTALALSSSFTQGLINWFNKLVISYMAAGLGTKKSFHIGTRMMEAIFEYVNAPREGVRKGLKVGDERQMSRSIFWSTLCSLDRMSEVRRLNYGDLPAVSAALIKFLATNIGTEQIQKIQGEMTETRAKNVGLERIAKEASASAKAATNALNLLSIRVDKLQRTKADK